LALSPVKKTGIGEYFSDDANFSKIFLPLSTEICRSEE
jgi:hypothetical protein